MTTGRRDTHFHLFLLVMAVTIGISAYSPHHQILWFAHSITVFFGLAVLTTTYRRFAFTPLAYFVMWLYGTVMMIGAHYTYEQEPLFHWLQQTFELSRNYFDRFGHFFQGFTPAIITREILIRQHVVASKRWLFFITLSICLAISAFYELTEWWFALASGKKAEISLGMQGDFWDTQWDMFMAFIGAVFGQLLLGKRHDRQIAQL